MNATVSQYQNVKPVKEKQLLIIKKGITYLTLKTAEIALIYTLKDVTYIVNREGKKFSYAQNLNRLEQELDHRFFRANRQYIININYIRSFRAHEKSKLLVEVNVNNTIVPITISQITAPKFKEWVAGF